MSPRPILKVTSLTQSRPPLRPPQRLVRALATLEYPESPRTLWVAFTRNAYWVLGDSPVTECDVTFAPTLVSSDHDLPPLVEISIRKPSSFADVSVHVRSIWLRDTAVAIRLVGALGGAGG